MTDPKKAVGELGAKAAFAAAKDAAERALEQALETDEERDARKAREVERAKRRRTKRLVLAVLGVVIVLGLIGLALRYWYWFLLLGLVGLAALYGRYRWRKHRARGGRRAAELPAADEPARKQPLALPAPRTAAVAAARSAEPSGASIEDELAELKARLKK